AGACTSTSDRISSARSSTATLPPLWGSTSGHRRQQAGARVLLSHYRALLRLSRQQGFDLRGHLADRGKLPPDRIAVAVAGQRDAADGLPGDTEGDVGRPQLRLVATAAAVGAEPAGVVAFLHGGSVDVEHDAAQAQVQGAGGQPRPDLAPVRRALQPNLDLVA